MKIVLPETLFIDVVNCLLPAYRAITESTVENIMVNARLAALAERKRMLDHELEQLKMLTEMEGERNPSPKISTAQREINAKLAVNWEDQEKWDAEYRQAKADFELCGQPLSINCRDVLLRLVAHYSSCATRHGLPIPAESMEKVKAFAALTVGGVALQQAASTLLPILRCALVGKMDLWPGSAPG